MPDVPPLCPECASEYTYELGGLQVCSMCAHEWSLDPAEDDDDAGSVIRDAVGNVTKVRNIRLVNGVGDHDIDCRVDGFGPMQLKSSVVKKA